MIPDTDRAILVATIVAGFNANPYFDAMDDSAVVDAAFVQAALILERIEAERDARYQLVDAPHPLHGIQPDFTSKFGPGTGMPP